MSRIPLWIDLREVPVNKRLPYWKAIQRCGADAVVLGTDDPHLDREGIRAIRLDGNGALKEGKRTDVMGRLVKLRSAKDQERAKEIDGVVLIDGDDWTIIPLENLIAARRDRPGTLFGLARSVEEAIVFRETLEIGVHGICLAPASPQDIADAHSALVARGARTDDVPVEAAPEGHFLVPATVTEIKDAGPGDRVCIDTTSVFRDGEGLLIGSTATGFALVHAETIESEYVRARPFRVNAGAVHSYLYVPDGKTVYLSELQAGKNVLAIHPDGVHRVLTVGRSKIERRPHVLVAWKTEAGNEGNAILQTAETIRLVRPDGTPVAVTDLQIDEEILVHTESTARHFGMPVKEALTEL